MTKQVFFSICAILILLVSLSVIVNAKDIDSVKNDMLNLIPNDGFQGGWKLSEPAKYYKAEPSDPAALNPILSDQRAASIPSLWEYIDGAADIYYTYGFIVLQLNRWQNVNIKGAEITVEIYLMINPLNAFGIYSAEKKGVEEFMDIKTQGYYVKDSLIFWRGPYYIKMSAYGFDDADGKILKSLAQTISGRIEDQSAAPDEMTLFPDLPGAQINAVYVPSELLGLGILGDGFVTDVTYKNKNYKLLIKTFDNKSKSAELFESISAFLLKSGKEESVPAGWQNIQIKIIKGSMIGDIILIQKDGYLAGITEFENQDEALIVADLFNKSLK